MRSGGANLQNIGVCKITRKRKSASIFQAFLCFLNNPSLRPPLPCPHFILVLLLLEKLVHTIAQTKPKLLPTTFPLTAQNVLACP